MNDRTQSQSIQPISKKIARFTLSMGLILDISNSAWANFSGCSQNFVNKTPPSFTQTMPQKAQDQAYPLCFDGFAVMYSAISKTPLWSAERLTEKRLNLAEKIPRNDNFHEETQLPKAMRANLSDYSRSGFDRGHLAPNGDMANQSQQYDSFSLANIAPQSPRHNRYLWKNLESTTRLMGKKYGEIYVITGVAFEGKTVKQLNKNVLVPSHFYKAIYIPSLKQAGVYFSPNDDSERLEIISLNQLKNRINIDLMPSLESKIKSHALSLPTNANEVNKMPNTSKNKTQNTNSKTAKNTKNKEEEKPWWMLLLAGLLSWLVGQFS